MLRKIEGRRRRGQHGKMVGWHHQLNGYGLEWTPGVDDGQGSLPCCSSWGRKELDRTERLNNNNVIEYSVSEILSLLFCSGNPYL